MMLFSTKVFASLFVTVSVFTSSVAGVYVKYCEHANFGGTCIEISPAVGTCHNVPSHMNDKLSSYVVDNGHCDFYKHANCVEKLWTAKNRSHNEVTTVGHKDEVSSIKCTYSCCNPDDFFLCNSLCTATCKPAINNPIVDQGCILRCAQGCCLEGVQCSD
ncbi:hypothetical protein QBC41DRAFT_306115 [Cercophora samala]|uniref:Uncharacterized protein n=1 Tax=Cercophora samala TaxID=330535 RepID=A0AA39Z773_9PEZI|nr:hypothetical protein QBC41DRAFT_306115 [Cercophora samala]